MYNFVRHGGSHKTLNNYTEKGKNRKISHSQHSHNIRRNTGLRITDRHVYLNSLQSLFLYAKYLCIKLCRLFSATCLTDWQLNAAYNLHSDVAKWNCFVKSDTDRSQAECMDCMKLVSLGSSDKPGKQTVHSTRRPIKSHVQKCGHKQPFALYTTKLTNTSTLRNTFWYMFLVYQCRI